MEATGREEDNQINDLRNTAKAKALMIFGDSDQIAFARVEAGGSDHCNGAKKAVRLCAEKGKSEEQMKKCYGEEEWAALGELQRKWKSIMIEFGCQHHYRCIGWAGGDKLVCGHLKDLLKDDVEKVREQGVMCVDGTADASIRSILLFFGNTWNKNHLSVGADLRAFAAETGETELAEREDFSSVQFLDQGQVKTGERQDGIGSKCWLLELTLPIMSAFITRYHERAEDNNYYKVVQINYMSDKLELT